jgi:hypothetical protein
MTKIVPVIRQLIEVCRGYDPGFHSASAYYAELCRLSLDCVPEEELEHIAEEFGTKVHRPIDFSVGYDACPTVRPSAYIRVGRLTVSLLATVRKATPGEIAESVANINEKVKTCCRPTDFHPASASPITTEDVFQGGAR